ncbi:hypothetical protein EWM64_g9459 [Hericium alpestre]|uniref:Tyr recombinase domain-containing protein n=1 Tax=Hericium alpestre TaxID=135208 RepID=A0A4Y9ZIY4_9AGAM|nr:hypothetical protein EWM64_g9459 [Hericium alpestre]
MLMRIDEVTNIDARDVHVIPGERQFFDIRLRVCKAQQTGVQHKWRLFANDDDVKVSKQGAVLHGDAVKNSVLSRTLTSDLQALGYLSWPLYGTHSFRRGGCQHHIKNKGWTVDMVAAWGGWSQVEALTMFRYFYSPNDNHEHMSEYDRNEPKRRKVVA